MLEPYEFTVDWFTQHWPNWLIATARQTVSKILEIGSFEGRSSCAMIEQFSKNGPLELFCVDNWAGNPEHAHYDMAAVERRFDDNTKRAVKRATNPAQVHKYKGSSAQELAGLLYNGHRNSFDLVFIDGSHQAPDVLIDLSFSYQLCAVGGLIICDDYLWCKEPHGREDLLNMPRPAIDAFMTLFARRVEQLASLPLYQVYLRKTA